MFLLFVLRFFVYHKARPPPAENLAFVRGTGSRITEEYPIIL